MNNQTPVCIANKQKLDDRIKKLSSFLVQKIKQTEQHQKPDGILTKKINGKTFVTEIYFDKQNTEPFQDKLFKVIHYKGDNSE